MYLFIALYVHHLHPIGWGFFSSYKQSFLPPFVYVSACQRSASHCLCTLLLLLPHPVYRSATASIAPRCWAELPIALQDVLVTLTWAAWLEPNVSSLRQWCRHHLPQPNSAFVSWEAQIFQLFLTWKCRWGPFVVPSLAKTVDRHTAEGWKISWTLPVPSTWSLTVDSILASHWTWRKKGAS